MSLWELAIKVSLKKVEVDLEKLFSEAQANGIVWVQVEASHTLAYPKVSLAHGDPFDRMLLAWASSIGAKLLTVDRNLRNHQSAIRL